MNYTPIEDGLKKCMAEFVKDGCQLGNISSLREAYFDKASHARIKLSDFSGMKQKIKYIIARYTPYFTYKRIKSR